jgi:hypothetical protein
MELIPYDESNQPLDVQPVTQLINAGAKDGSPVTTPLSLELNDPDNQLVNLRGFGLVFKARSNETVAGAPIKPNNFIKAVLKARLNGGMTLHND